MRRPVSKPRSVGSLTTHTGPMHFLGQMVDWRRTNGVQGYYSTYSRVFPPMSGILRVSEATSLGLHAMVAMAQQPDGPLAHREIAAAFGVSQAHLAKVLQRLGRVGWCGRCGARGGFMLARPADRIALLHIYEAIEGPIPMGNCLFAAPVCKQRDCILGELLESVNSQFVDYMARTRLADLASSLPATRSAPAAGREG